MPCRQPKSSVVVLLLEHEDFLDIYAVKDVTMSRSNLHERYFRPWLKHGGVRYPHRSLYAILGGLRIDRLGEKLNETFPDRLASRLRPTSLSATRRKAHV